MNIVQIVPSLPPAIDGVGDYACLLARQLYGAHGIETRFLICDPAWTGPPHFAGLNVDKLDVRKGDALQRQIRGSGMSIVVLHYVGYGYQQRGVPFWLVRGIASWKRAYDGRRLIVMFHELYASGPPWRSSFWMWPFQRLLVSKLARLAEHCVSNLAVNIKTLRRMTGYPEGRFSLLPVFSNVGEQSEAPDVARRKPRMIVFGSPGWRRQVYQRHLEALELACRQLGLTEIVDIGPPCGELPQLSVPRLEKGCLSPEMVSNEMRDARAGFFTYPAAYLGKSGVFAAYAAHALVPVTYTSNISANKDGLSAYEHFLPISSAVAEKSNMTIARQAQDWYLSHRISRQASHYAGVIRSLLGSEEESQQ